MFYSKYFEGSVDSSTASMIYAPLKNKEGASSTNVSNADKTKLEVIGNAIADTLHDCGMLGARYNVDVGYLYFDYANSDIGIHLNSYNNVSNARFLRAWSKADTDLILGYNTTNGSVMNSDVPLTGLFSGTSYVAANYKFCVTVKGEPTGFFVIYLGTYTNPTSLQYCVGTFFNAEDKRTELPIFGYRLGALPATAGDYYISADTLESVKVANATTGEPALLTPAATLTMLDNHLVLIDSYMTNAGFVALQNTYIGPGLDTDNTFYEIDSEVYYYKSPYITKCVTQVTPSED